jgi:hypothetical protein
MSQRIRGVTSCVIRTLTACCLGASTLLSFSACSDEERVVVVDGVSEVGRLQLNLTGVSTTHQVYRLRNGVFAITGRATGISVQVSTETDPDQSSLLVELAPDTYDVFLKPGFSLEKLSGGLPLSARRESTAAAPGSVSSSSLVRRPRAGAAAAGADAGAPPGDGAPSGDAPSTGAAIEVEAELISSNPGVASITPNAVSPLDFVFRVTEGTVVTGSGVLDIGLEVIDDDAACINDGFEPNEDLTTATPITPGTSLTATACANDIDTFVFTPPVPSGQFFSVTLSFATGAGELESLLTDTTSGNLVAADFGSSPAVLVAVATGSDFALQTLLIADDPAGATYSVDIAPFQSDAANQCCEVSGQPGCNDPEVLQCVCAQDSFCCSTSFDEICVGEALACGSQCVIPGADSDCCTASSAPGCTDPSVNSCVCGIDSQCCSGAFDQVCVAEAVSECAAACTPPPPQSDCCGASAVPGCTVPDVQSCVCGIDPYCCAGAFDQNCAALAQEQCNAVCQH